jgi:hypothetical protein
MPNISTFSSVESHLFVRIAIDDYRTTSGGAYSSTVLRFSDFRNTATINSESYAPLGKLMAITSTSKELRPSAGELTITMVGIPNTALGEILYSRIKGSPVEIYRDFFNPTTGIRLAVDYAPFGRFKGYVTNYSIQEEYDVDARDSTITIALTCASVVETLSNKIVGRRTNPSSQKSFYPTDLSMDRVPTLKDAVFDFGVPK